MAHTTIETVAKVTNPVHGLAELWNKDADHKHHSDLPHLQHGSQPVNDNGQMSKVLKLLENPFARKHYHLTAADKEVIAATDKVVGTALPWLVGGVVGYLTGGAGTGIAKSGTRLIEGNVSTLTTKVSEKALLAKNVYIGSLLDLAKKVPVLGLYFKLLEKVYQKANEMGGDIVGLLANADPSSLSKYVKPIISEATGGSGDSSILSKDLFTKGLAKVLPDGTNGLVDFAMDAGQKLLTNAPSKTVSASDTEPVGTDTATKTVTQPAHTTAKDDEATNTHRLTM